MKIDTGVEGILRFGLSNLRVCNICISGGRDVRSAPLKLTQVARYMYQVPLRLFKHLNNIAIITATV
jgi:hypothetical protein